MSYIQRATELIGRPVVTLDHAIDVAEVKDVVFDSLKSDLIGFTLRGRGMLGSPHAGMLPIANMRSIGRDAIVIETDAAIVESVAELAEAEAAHQNVIGNAVITDEGRQVGEVRNLILRITGATADVAGYEVEAPDGTLALVPIPETFSVSGEMVIVPARVDQFITNDITGFGAALDRFRLKHDD